MPLLVRNYCDLGMKEGLSFNKSEPSASYVEGIHWGYIGKNEKGTSPALKETNNKDTNT